eukprot:TRINITY_DN129_c3_g1_i1.p2 TRINITY_DN129_c3_g1~~TRINITY_DN129_c3_g1_i1.p2  ORF type:complete len:141 (+),score=36.95 TRINITY_DN129_c3_g1_i1:45-467(+)
MGKASAVWKDTIQRAVGVIEVKAPCEGELSIAIARAAAAGEDTIYVARQCKKALCAAKSRRQVLRILAVVTACGEVCGEDFKAYITKHETAIHVAIEKYCSADPVYGGSMNDELFVWGQRAVDATTQCAGACSYVSRLPF